LAHTEDVNSDGLIDLVVQIEDTGQGFTAGTTTATLTGTRYDGTPCEGGGRHLHCPVSRGTAPQTCQADQPSKGFDGSTYTMFCHSLPQHVFWCLALRFLQYCPTVTSR
jgi:hypothetical protein